MDTIPFSNTVGVDNVGFGAETLYHNISGNYNSAAGTSTLLTTPQEQPIPEWVIGSLLNTTGNNNTALGFDLYSNTTGGSNGLGYYTLVQHHRISTMQWVRSL